MRQPIETAPKDGRDIWVEDDRAAYDVAHWSSETKQWVWKTGGAIRITPTHWSPLLEPEYQEEQHSSSQLPFGRVRRRLTASLLATALVVATLTGVHFRSEMVGFATRFADLLDADDLDTVVGRESSGSREIETHVAQSQKAADVATKQQPAAEATIAELKQIVEQEQKRTADLIQEARAAQAEATAAESQRRALEETQARAAAFASELAGTRREIETQVAQSQKIADTATRQKQAAEATIAELKQTIEQEQKKTAAVTQEAKVVQAKAIAAAESTIAELRQTLKQEQKKTADLVQEAKAAQAGATAAEPQRRALEEAQARAAALASELAGTRREIETQVAQSQKVADTATRQKQAAEATIAELKQTIEQEQKKTAAATQEAKVAQAKAIAAAESTIAELSQTLKQEQKKTADLVQEAKAAQAGATAAEPQRRALEEAQARAAALASELAGTRREIETQVAQSQKAADTATRQKQAGEATIAELKQAIEQEQKKTAAVTQEAKVAQAKAIAAAESTIAELRQTLKQQQKETADLIQEGTAAEPTMDGRVTTARLSDSQVVRVTQSVKTPTREPPKVVEAQVNAEAAKLIARAIALLGQGNIGAARTVLERAVESGNAQASFMLAETYDPIILSAWGTHGTRGEATIAREHYAKAQAGGIREAKDRLEALRQ